MTRPNGMARLATDREAPQHRMTTMAPPVIAHRMTTVREAFHQQRLAHEQRHLWMFYLEHNLFDQARDSRLLMLGHLRSACQQWRLTLGTAR